MSIGAIIAIVISSIILALIVTFFVVLPKRVYFSAMFSGAYISAFKLIGMKGRKVDYVDIANSYVLAKKAKLGIVLYDLEVISASGGRPMNIVKGLTAAQAAKLNMSFDFAKALDISGYDIPLVIESLSKPKIIEMPLVTAVTQDNVEVNVKLALTLKINFKNFLRGVTEDTISTRAMEAVVKKIANVESAEILLAHPEYVDKAVVDAEVDSDSKYDIASIDVILLDIAKDGKIEAEKAELEKKRIITANQLEQRRLTAVAVEQEMKARTEEMKSKAAAGEAEISKAIVKAIEEGKMQDILDYYKLQEIQADLELKKQMLNKAEHGEVQ